MRDYNQLQLKGNNINEAVKTEVTGKEKSKLLPTDIGIVVNDFLMAIRKSLTTIPISVGNNLDFSFPVTSVLTASLILFPFSCSWL